MNKLKRAFTVALASCMTAFGTSFGAAVSTAAPVSAAEDVSASMEWGTLTIGGAGFVSAIVTGQENMYARTDVGGAYKYNYEKDAWEQLFGFLNEADRGLLSVSGIAIDPTDDDTVYFLCGCAYFSDARTVIFKTTDGGKTFTRTDVTDMIQVHANGDGRECTEPIAIDPDNPDVIYCGGDVTAGESCLIKSTDGGKTWNPVIGYDDLGLYTNQIKWPEWTSHMARGTTSGAYNTQNGVATVKILGGKVYVGTSITGTANIHVADVDKDEFTVLSADLPTANFPVSISSDNNGNLFFTYIAGLAFSGSAGGIFKYNIESGEVKDISPANAAYGVVTADKTDPDKLVTRTCGLWSDQWWESEWTDDSIAWGDYFYRSEDGGETWENITPGKSGGNKYEGTDYAISLPLDTGGYDWIYGKAIHWGSSMVIDPIDENRVFMSSGNGVFACDNVWDERNVQFYFHPDGIEEVVALDFVSVPGGANYSAIGDYDGFIHSAVDEIGIQYKPNIGSTGAIAYCPENPKVMARASENEAKGYYSLDGGITWTELKIPNGGGKMAITQLKNGDYRIFKSESDNAKISYTDDFGSTWKEASGLDGSKASYILVDPSDPSKVYAYTYKYNAYWASNPSLTEPSFAEAHYSVYTSNDYGATFSENQICRYDMCDHCGDLAYIKEDTIAAAAGWYGMYIITENGTNAEKTDVYYCKTIGYGAPEKDGGANTLFMYGKPAESDPEGIYRSTDEGKTWVCINTDHLYGGTGNGNFLVGDMNEFGTVYMSTVGCGIVYGRIASDVPPTTDDDDIIYGDANDNGTVEIADAVFILQSIADPSNSDYARTAQGEKNADCHNVGNGVDVEDALAIQRYKAEIVESLPTA